MTTDEAYIDLFISKLSALWKANPHLTFAQLTAVLAKRSEYAYQFIPDPHFLQFIETTNKPINLNDSGVS
jgi:hypothetical protein